MSMVALTPVIRAAHGRGGLEKRGRSAELAQAEMDNAATVAFADEMRVGRIGQVRRRWVPKGFELEQAVEYT